MRRALALALAGAAPLAIAVGGTFTPFSAMAEAATAWFADFRLEARK